MTSRSICDEAWFFLCTFHTVEDQEKENSARNLDTGSWMWVIVENVSRLYSTWNSQESDHVLPRCENSMIAKLPSRWSSMLVCSVLGTSQVAVPSNPNDFHHQEYRNSCFFVKNLNSMQLLTISLRITVNLSSLLRWDEAKLERHCSNDLKVEKR